MCLCWLCMQGDSLVTTCRDSTLHKSNITMVILSLIDNYNSFSILMLNCSFIFANIAQSTRDVEIYRLDYLSCRALWAISLSGRTVRICHQWWYVLRYRVGLLSVIRCVTLQGGFAISEEMCYVTGWVCYQWWDVRQLRPLLPKDKPGGLQKQRHHFKSLQFLWLSQNVRTIGIFIGRR